jgi:phosphoribosylaminoimidazolecarboxamide formyltransferase/IMP cyclohydrolase
VTQSPSSGRVERALLSVSDKTGLVDFARGLAAAGTELLASGNTARALRDAGLQVVEISDYTGFPEMMGGRIKTLHPRIHGGILARRDVEGDLASLDERGIRAIDLVVVNLYPFEETISREGVSLAEAIEQIDIGGPTLIRAAAKNHAFVSVVVDPGDYGRVLEALGSHDGCVPAELRAELARKAFGLTARYDAAISGYLESRAESEDGLPAALAIAKDRTRSLRYGENPHQAAAIYGPLLELARPLHGKELSYNNVLDVDAALGLILDFLRDPPTVAILKHNTPCGVASATELVSAWSQALASDPDSPFGGIVITNRPFDAPLAQAVDEIFTEVLVAPSFAPEALELLRRKKNRRLIEFDPTALVAASRQPAVRSVIGGYLCQQRDNDVEDASSARVVTQRKPSEQELRGLGFAWKVCKHVRSNAIVFAGGSATLAVAGGGTNRVDQVHAAAARAGRVGVDLQGSVLASEAFFPFPDGVEAAAAHGATAVIQPGGSVRDDEVIAAADRLGLGMVFTGVRHFRH